MKKVVLFLLVGILVLAALPIVGNSVMQKNIETRVSELESYGLKATQTKSKSTYLTSSQHFEFVLKNADEFVNYLKKYSDQQIPPYVNAMLEGVVIGADLEYSNLPFSKAIELDIYPLSVSPEMENAIKEDSLELYSYIEKFLHSKGVLYHINYNIVSEDFDGYLKNINEKYTPKDGGVLTLTLKDATFKGNGELIAPNRMSSIIKELSLNVKKDSEIVTFKLVNLLSSTSTESKNTYLTSADLENFTIAVDAKGENTNIDMKNIHINVSSNAQGEFAELNSKSSIDSLTIESQQLNMAMKKFNFDIATNGVDKKVYEELEELISETKASGNMMLDEKIQKTVIELLSKGLVINIADFSVQNITLDTTDNLQGFKIKSVLTLKEDKDFGKKLQMSPMMLISNVEIQTDIRVSREIYAKLTKNRPIPPVVKEYMKEDGNDIIFNISYLDGKAKVNGKPLR